MNDIDHCEVAPLLIEGVHPHNGVRRRTNMETYKGYEIRIEKDEDGDWSLLIDGNQEMLITDVQYPNEDILIWQGKQIVDNDYIE